jgi:hypothetical protein
MAKKLPRTKLAELERLLALDEEDTSGEVEIDIALSEIVTPEEWKHGFVSMSAERRKYLACFYLETEVNNGGFNQFMFNKGPEAVTAALEFLDERGPEAVAQMLRRAIDALPGGILPDTYDEMEALLADEVLAPPIDEAHNTINDEFFESDEPDHLLRRRLELVRDHPDEFFA